MKTRDTTRQAAPPWPCALVPWRSYATSFGWSVALHISALVLLVVSAVFWGDKAPGRPRPPSHTVFVVNAPLGPLPAPPPLPELGTLGQPAGTPLARRTEAHLAGRAAPPSQALAYPIPPPPLPPEGTRLAEGAFALAPVTPMVGKAVVSLPPPVSPALPPVRPVVEHPILPTPPLIAAIPPVLSQPVEDQSRLAAPRVPSVTPLAVPSGAQVQELARPIELQAADMPAPRPEAAQPPLPVVTPPTPLSTRFRSAAAPQEAEQEQQHARQTIDALRARLGGRDPGSDAPAGGSDVVPAPALKSRRDVAGREPGSGSAPDARAEAKPALGEHSDEPLGTRMRAYWEHVKALITEAWNLQAAPQLQATAVFLVDRQGRVYQLKLVKPSGHARFDQSLLWALQHVALPPPPADAPDEWLAVEMHFVYKHIASRAVVQ